MATPTGTAPSPLASTSPLDRARRAVYLRALPILIVAYIVAYVDRTNLSLAKLAMVKDLPAFDNAVFGIGAGAFFLGFVLLEVPGTMLVERWSARKLIAIIMAVWGICASATAFVSTPTQLYVVRFFLGIAEGSFFPGVVVYLGHWFPQRDRTKALGFFVLGSPLAQVLMPKLAGALMGMQDQALHGWQWLFIVSGAPGVLLAIVVLYFLTDRPEQAAWLGEAEKAALCKVLAEEKAARSSVAGHMSIGQALRNPKVMQISLGHFLAIICFYGVEFFLPSVLSRWFSLSVDSLTWLMMLAAAASFVGVLFVAWNSDRTRERRWHTAVPLAAAGTVTALMPLLQNHLWATIVLYAVAAAGVKAYLPAFWSLPSLFLSGSAAAASIGFINSLGNVGGFIGPSVLGSVEKATGSFSGGLVFIGVAAICASAVLASLRLPRQS
jgi:MFS transporter, ACS family, tartrate transporter